MPQNILKSAFRNIAKHRSFSMINIAGLTLGITACILIGLFVWDEHKYDKFLPGSDQVYRLYSEYRNTERTQMMAATPPVFASTLEKDFPEVENTARVMNMPENKTLFEAGKNKFYEQSGYFVDSTFLLVFPLKFKEGSPVKALDDRNSVVISEEMAERFFGAENPVGKQILRDKTPYLVKGVFVKDPRFHLQFNYLMPLSAIGLPEQRMQSWGWHQFITYAKLKKQTDVKALELKFQEYVREKEKAARTDGSTNADKPFFQPLQDVHLYSSDFKFDIAQRGNIGYVNALTVIAIFILLIACFNFVNLATAKSLQRAKEVGVRKSIGASRGQLMIQFIAETTVLGFISAILAVCVSLLLLPWLNQFTNKTISISLFANPFVWALLIALTILVGIMAGLYPALVLSAFKPVKVLKGNLTGSEQGGKIPWLRHSLVIMQFSLSVILITSAIIVLNQTNYLQNKDLGFNKEQIMFFPMRGENMFKNVDAFKNELMKAPGVSSVSIGYGFPGDAVAGDEIIVPNNGKMERHSATQLLVDYDYIKTLGLQLVAGRDFSKTMSTDKDHAWIINETAVKQLGFGSVQNALGQELSWNAWGVQNPDSLKTGKIIGIVKDFNYKSLYDKVELTVLQILPSEAWKVAVKMGAAGKSNTVAAVTRAWNKFTPEYPIEYKFLDENFEQMYTAENKLRSLLCIFTGIAIFICCLGLFSLATYTAARRRKEIGIRKVLGASISGVVILLSKDFIALVVVSLLIAFPVAGYFMNKWLQQFAYRININWTVFAITAVLALTIAFATVCFQAIKAAIANPVKSLRTE